MNVLAVSLTALAILGGCSKSSPPDQPPRAESASPEDASVEQLKALLLEHLSETCEMSALAAVWSTSEGRALEESCPSWKVHGSLPPNTPRDLSRNAVAVFCEGGSQPTFTVDVRSGGVSRVERGGTVTKISSDAKSSEAAAKACAHIFD
jgi:hypothetical protein